MRTSTHCLPPNCWWEAMGFGWSLTYQGGLRWSGSPGCGLRACLAPPDSWWHLMALGLLEGGPLRPPTHLKWLLQNRKQPGSDVRHGIRFPPPLAPPESVKGAVIRVRNVPSSFQTGARVRAGDGSWSRPPSNSSIQRGAGGYFAEETKARGA